MIRLLSKTLLVLFLFTLGPFAETRAQGIQEQPSPSSASSLYQPTLWPERPRSPIWPPLFSLILPGLDQWIEHQNDFALAYTGVAGVGTGIALANYDAAKSVTTDSLLKSKDNGVRGYLLGTQMIQSAGCLSAFHSFRTAAATRPGDYDFLTVEESPQDLVLSPFRSRYLSRWTTWVPLGLALAGTWYEARTDYVHRTPALTQSDVAYSGGFSYMAGVSEEALFRGWIMPLWAQTWGSPFWANTGQALLFAAAHLPSTSLPITQGIMGFYFGYLVQENQWTLGEAIFIHTWWDVIAFLGHYSVTGQRGYLPLPTLAWAF